MIEQDRQPKPKWLTTKVTTNKAFKDIKTYKFSFIVYLLDPLSHIQWILSVSWYNEEIAQELAKEWID